MARGHRQDAPLRHALDATSSIRLRSSTRRYSTDSPMPLRVVQANTRFPTSDVSGSGVPL